MALQEEGWPLGLRPVSARIGTVRDGEFNGSISFSTLLTASPTCTTDSSSDLDTESTRSFFHDKSITLGSLIGVSSILELSRRSTWRRAAETGLNRDERNCKSKFRLFSLCSKRRDAVNSREGAPSLGHFLRAERRAPHSNLISIEPNDFSPVMPSNSGQNPLFVGDEIAPVQASDEDGGRRISNTEGLSEDENGYGAPLFFSCLCGQLIES